MKALLREVWKQHASQEKEEQRKRRRRRRRGSKGTYLDLSGSMSQSGSEV
jgi:hypothetical protein